MGELFNSKIFSLSLLSTSGYLVILVTVGVLIFVTSFDMRPTDYSYVKWLAITVPITLIGSSLGSFLVAKSQSKIFKAAGVSITNWIHVTVISFALSCAVIVSLLYPPIEFFLSKLEPILICLSDGLGSRYEAQPQDVHDIAEIISSYCNFWTDLPWTILVILAPVVPGAITGTVQQFFLPSTMKRYLWLLLSGIVWSLFGYSYFTLLIIPFFQPFLESCIGHFVPLVLLFFNGFLMVKMTTTYLQWQKYTVNLDNA